MLGLGINKFRAWSGNFINNFSIAKSFYLDGVDESFVVDANDINSYISGTNKQFSLSFGLKRTEINSFNHFFGEDISNGIIIRFNSTNEINFLIYNSGYTSMSTTSTFTDTTEFYFINIIYDGVTPSNSKIYVNGVDEVLSSNTLGSIIQNGTSNYLIGGRIAADYFNGYYNSFSVIDRLLTPTDVTNYYNNGKPKDPQALFGANCKYFFNPDNSNDTAQFSVVDSVNSITATSVNMVDADKTPITPYADPLADLVTTYGFLNAWSGENIEISGTTTTVKDYLAEHDLSNPAVANQPSFVGGTSSLGNRPTLVNDGVDDYLYKAVSDWRGSDGSGCFIMVYDDDGGGVNNIAYAISSSDELTNDNFIFSQHWLSGLRPLIKTSGTVYSYYTTPTNIFGTANVVAFGSNGTTNKAFINGVLQTTNVLAGTDSGQWMDAILNRDNILLFGQILSSTFTSSTPMKLAFVGYLPYTDDATIIACQNELKTIFNIS